MAYSPGGAVDTIARAMARDLEPILGQRVIVRNKPGAGGEIGYRSLAASNNDGYTLGMITAPPVLMLDIARKNSAEPIANFNVLASVQKDPVMFVVNADSDYVNLNELLLAAREADELINVAGDGPMSNNQLQLAVAEASFDVMFNFVPYSGSGPSIAALLGKQVEAAVPSASSSSSYIKRGDIRALAVFSTMRYQYLPDVPTVFEATGIDVPDIGAAVRGVVLPKGVNDSTRKILADAIETLLQSDDFTRYASSIELPLHYMPANEFSLYMESLDRSLRVYMPLLLSEEN